MASCVLHWHHFIHPLLFDYVSSHGSPIIVIMFFWWLQRERDCTESFPKKSGDSKHSCGALLIFSKESFALKNDSWLWQNQKMYAHSHYNLTKMTHEVAIFFLVLIDSILIDSWVAIIKKGEIVVLYVLMMRQHGLIIWHVLMMR